MVAYLKNERKFHPHRLYDYCILLYIYTKNENNKPMTFYENNKKYETKRQ